MRILILLGFFTSSVFAFDATKYIDAIKPSKPYENIHVVPLATNEHASDFLVFIKNEVKAHYHKNHTEIVYVLSGEAEFTLDKTTEKVSKGSYVRIEPGQVHSVKVTSSKPLKVLSIQTPQFFGKDRIFIDNP